MREWLFSALSQDLLSVYTAKGRDVLSFTSLTTERFSKEGDYVPEAREISEAQKIFRGPRDFPRPRRFSEAREIFSGPRDFLRPKTFPEALKIDQNQSQDMREALNLCAARDGMDDYVILWK